MVKQKEEIESQFWAVISKSKQSLEVLIEQLEVLDKESLELYFGCYKYLSESLCDAWDGPYINEEIGNLSEDSTEDLCNWIVAEGNDFFYKVKHEQLTLQEAFFKMIENKDNGKSWDLNVSNPAYKGSQDPLYIAAVIYEEKFDEDLFNIEEDILVCVEKLLP